MSDDSPRQSPARRSVLSRLGAGVTMAGAALVFGGSRADAQSPGGGDWRPARHAQDDWMDRIPGKHRFVFDTTTPAGFGSALAFANNYFIANQTGYGLGDGDAAVIIVARHFSTPFAYKDPMWAKYGTVLAQPTQFDDPKTRRRPTINVYTAAGYSELPSMGVTVDTVAKRGVQFAVCQMATRHFADLAAQATGGNADTIYNELVANLIGNSHLAAAGIVAVNRAQERGYTSATAV